MLFLERAHAAAGMGHFVLDPISRTIEFSTWIRDNLGLNNQPIPIERLPEIIAPHDRKRVGFAIAGAMGSQIDFEFEATVVTADGSHHVQNVSGIAAFEDPESREGLVGFFGIIRDITEEKSTEGRLRLERDEAKSQLDSKTNILAVISHEIRTPLGGILGIIDCLKKEPSALERERALRLVEESCNALLDTLDGILQQARIGQDLENLESEPFRPKAIAQRVAELFRPLARRKGIRIEVEFASENQVIGDEARLQQIIANLVSNAVKFTHSGHVRISVEEPGKGLNDWVFVVSDTGSGMDERRANSVFDAFSPTEKDTLGKNSGAGLGLSIVKELVDLMQGEISIDSTLGEGSEFTVSLAFDSFESDQADDLEMGIYGSALVLVEQASNRIQIEAIANQYGLIVRDLTDFKDMNDIEGPLAALIVGTDLIDQIPKELLGNSGPPLLLIDGSAPSEIDSHLAKSAQRIASASLTQELTNWFEGKHVAVA